MRARACTGNEEFIGGAMLPLRPWVNVKELRVSRVLEGVTFPAANLGAGRILPGPPTVRYILVPVNP